MTDTDFKVTEKTWKFIQKQKTFKSIFSQVGEDLDYALEIWIERNYDLVDVRSIEDQEKLISDISKLSS